MNRTSNRPGVQLLTIVKIAGVMLVLGFAIRGDVVGWVLMTLGGAVWLLIIGLGLSQWIAYRRRHVSGSGSI